MTDSLDDDEVVHEVVVTEAARLDAAVAALVSQLSRAQAQRLIDDGRVSVNGMPAAKPSARVSPGDAITVAIPAPEPLELEPEDIPLVVLYEDSELIAIDKPAGLVVHPAPGHPRGTLVNALLYHCKDLAGVGGVLRPGIVHRLDKDTSGVMVATKTDRAHAALSTAFANKTDLERSYLGITAPPPRPAAATLRTLYGRHPVDRKRFSSKVDTGKSAVTRYETLATASRAALVRFRLETGRTHQIRVHAADHGFALVGDPVYGHRMRDDKVNAAAAALARQALHASTLAFAHPTTGVRISLSAPLPADFIAAASTLGLALAADGS